MKKRILFIVLLLAIIRFSIYAQTFIAAVPSPNIPVGDSFKIEYTVCANKPFDVEWEAKPDFEGLKLWGGPVLSEQTVTAESVQYSKTFTYIVRCPEGTEVTLPAAQVKVVFKDEERTVSLKSNELKISAKGDVVTASKYVNQELPPVNNERTVEPSVVETPEYHSNQVTDDAGVVWEDYNVVCDSKLNIRQSPNGKVIGSLSNGAKVSVGKIENKWAMIRYNDGYGYISSEYIVRATPTGEDIIGNNETTGLQNRTICIFIALFLILNLTVASNRAKNGPHALSTACLLFIVVAGVEFTYQYFYGNDFRWFCDPNTVGWGMTIVNFIIFGVAVGMQSYSYINIISEVCERGYNDFSFMWGLISVIVGVVLLIFIQDEIARAIIYTLVGVIQLVQIGMLYSNVASRDGWIQTTFYAIAYVVGLAATLLLLINFIVLFIIVAIGFILLRAFTEGGSKSGGRSCGDCIHRDKSSNYCTRNRQYIAGDPYQEICDGHQ